MKDTLKRLHSRVQRIITNGIAPSAALFIFYILITIIALQPIAGAAHASSAPSGNSSGSLINTILNLTAEPSIDISEPRIVFPSNFQYDSEEKTFRISKTNGFTMDLNQAVHMDLYHQHQYIITLTTSNPSHIDSGEFSILDDYFQSVSVVQNTRDSSISLTFHLQQLKLFDLSEDENDYIIRAIHPSERYPFIVVIDPGHGGNQPGAVQSGVRESDLNLAVTLQLLDLIEQNENIRAYTTRNSDTSVGLRARARLGNEVGDIFISIHHNSALNRNARGIESFYFYYIPDDSCDYNDDDYCDCDEPYEENNIYDDLYDNAHLLSGRGLAEIMQRQLVSQIGFPDRRVHNRAFVVLQYSEIPATLLELGFMSNSQELAVMNTETFQRQAAQAIYDGLLEVFALYPPPR
ncbi:MAG: N-acetylmuramoyl-L-alanine amidase [Oscillospiraceae bacterium]|nr:N-acetylmuramoyl-L-alanine amidase [Oscillospiraceae bacterium]